MSKYIYWVKKKDLFGCFRIEDIRDKDNETVLKEGGGIEMLTTVLPFALHSLYLPNTFCIEELPVIASICFFASAMTSKVPFASAWARRLLPSKRRASANKLSNSLLVTKASFDMPLCFFLTCCIISSKLMYKNNIEEKKN